MDVLINRRNIRIGVGLMILTALILQGIPVFAGESSIKYPVERIVTGVVMEISPPFEKGRDGELNVDEKIYRITSRTVMVDEKEGKTDLDFFKTGDEVYMVVNLYADHREALFVSPK